MCNLFTLGRRAYAAIALGAMLVLGVATSTATAAPRAGRRTGEVFVQTNNPAGNAIVVYGQAPNGTLTQWGVYPTGGLGGALDGAVADHLASQGSLVLDRPDRLLYAVNAGSNSISVFEVNSGRLALLQVISSGGDFPVSIAVHRNLVYVLNARDGGSLQGYVRFGDRLVAVADWGRALGLDESFQDTSTEFLHSPGQVVFTPDGADVLVSTKANGNDIDVFAVDRDGGLSAAPVVDGAGAVPFAMAFDRSGHLVVTETGTSTIASLEVQPDGQLTPVSTVPTGQAASCWITTAAPDRLYVSNAGSATETGITDDAGDLADLGNTPTDAGTIDATATPNGRFLYVETGANGIVDEYAISRTGALTEIGSVVVPAPQGSEGIAAG